MLPRAQEVRTANLLGALAVRTTDATRDAVADATGLAPVEAAAVNLLASSLPGAGIQVLADGLGLSQPGATRLVDRLARRGVVRRGPGPDGRTRAVVLTEEGGRLAARVAEARRDALVALLTPLEPSARVALAAGIEQLLEPLATSTDDAVRGCRLCDPVACGHLDGRCPVTRGLDARGR